LRVNSDSENGQERTVLQILLVEDDRPLATGLIQALKKQAYAVNHVETGNSCIHTIEIEAPDIVILDLGLPDQDGLHVLKQLRNIAPTLPILVLTARNSADEKVLGLDSGADDYLAKPFEMTELLARLRVFERRLSTTSLSTITIDTVTLDINNHHVMINDIEIELSRKEYMLLKLLMENVGKILTRSKLESGLYGWNEEVASNAVEVHIHHLRKKLGMSFIKTVRGVGYKIDAQAEKTNAQ